MAGTAVVGLAVVVIVAVVGAGAAGAPLAAALPASGPPDPRSSGDASQETTATAATAASTAAVRVRTGRDRCRLCVVACLMPRRPDRGPADNRNPGRDPAHLTVTAGLLQPSTRSSGRPRGSACAGQDSATVRDSPGSSHR